MGVKYWGTVCLRLALHTLRFVTLRPVGLAWLSGIIFTQYLRYSWFISWSRHLEMTQGITLTANEKSADNDESILGLKPMDTESHAIRNRGYQWPQNGSWSNKTFKKEEKKP